MIGRGEIWWAELGIPEGAEPGYRRPVVIIQSDDYNRTSLKTVIVVSVTSNLKLAAMPGNVALSSRATGLPKDSVANVTQVITLNKIRLSKRIGNVSARKFAAIETGLKQVLAL